jgi:hypothetical protein
LLLLISVPEEVECISTTNEVSKLSLFNSTNTNSKFTN